MKKIAIIGGNGFIGKNLTDYLSEKDFEILCVDHSVKNNLDDGSNVRTAAVDIHHTKELLGSVKDCNFVIWLVHSSVPSTKDDSLVDDFMLNVSPIVRFLEKADELTKLEKFVYFSSGGTVYGDVSEHTPIKEELHQNPISNYGLSKSVIEKYVEYLTRKKHFSSAILRPSNVYGKFQNLVKPQGIIGFAFKAIRDSKSLDLYDEGKVIRDFVHVRDVADALLKTIEDQSLAGSTEVFNVGSQQGYSIKEIIDKIENISQQPIDIVHKSSRNFDCQYNVLNTEKLRNKYNWNANMSLENGLSEVWEWIKNDNEV